jgi:hypothetical protein
MSHTPGPWNIHPAYINDQPMPVRSDDGEHWNWLPIRIAKGERLIGYSEFNDCVNCGWPHVDNVEEAIANARLMVAAPELLAALEYLRMCIEDGVDPAMSSTNAAIAKARGACDA